MSAAKPVILIINGPNLGALGIRQPEIYGTEDMTSVPPLVDKLLGPLAQGIELEFFQSNHEGVLIDRLEKARLDKVAGVILNAGAFSHTSLALADCLAWIELPCVEVHLSNVLARANALRHQSHIAPHTIGLIAGFGITGYALAVQALVRHLQLDINMA
ncbi:MAG: type II 3-dehydroquinate dehydratase [Pseudomonadota bacterium]